MVAATLFVLVVSQLVATVTCSMNETASDAVRIGKRYQRRRKYRSNDRLSLTAIAVGIVTVVLGYRLFRATLFVVGFAFGGTGIAMATEHVFSTDERGRHGCVRRRWCSLWLLRLVFNIARHLRSRGSGWCHAGNGSQRHVRLHGVSGQSRDGPRTAVCGLVRLGGFLALKWEKPVLIVATSLLGAGILVWGIGFFAGDFPTFSDLKQFATQDANGDWQYSIPGAWCVYLAGFVVLFVLSMCIQFRKTSRRGHYHKQNARQHGPRSAPYIQA